MSKQDSLKFLQGLIDEVENWTKEFEVWYPFSFTYVQNEEFLKIPLSEVWYPFSFTYVQNYYVVASHSGNSLTTIKNNIGTKLYGIFLCFRLKFGNYKK